MPLRFRWSVRGAPVPVTVVLLDAGYAELARADGLGGTEHTTPDAFARVLATGGQFHWFVEAVVSGRTLRSRLQSFEIR